MNDDNGNGKGAMQVDPALVRQLAELLNEGDLSEIEIEDGDRRIRLKRKIDNGHTAEPAAPPSPPPPPAVPQAAAAAPVAGAIPPGALLSPMVGTAYLSSEPGAKTFVAVGDKVSAGDTVCIIEAMKVMNPIAATNAGTVRQILIQDGQPVEYDQPLAIVE